ncbi:MAG: MFS transporter [Nitriliruptorales bacterium]|nr:MFS transporter [Nitriliruptorales bacterium]
MGQSRNARHVIVARFVSGVGAEASFFVGLWGKAAFEFDGGPTELTVLAAMIGLGTIIGNITGGWMVDRWDARKVLIGAEVAFVPAVLGLAFTTTMTQLLVVGLIAWIADGFIETGLSSMAPALTDDERQLTRLNARIDQATWLAVVVGPGAGALIALVAPIDLVFVFDAATSIAAVALLNLVRLDPRDTDAPEPSLREIVGGFVYAARHRAVLLTMYLMGLASLSWGVSLALEPLYFRDILDLGPVAIGFVNSLFGLGLFAGSRLLDRSADRRLGFLAAIVISMISGVGAALYFGTASLAIVLVGAVVWSVPLGALIPLVRTLAQRATQPGMVGRVMGALTMQQNLSGVLPLAFAPALAGALGVQFVLVGAGVLIIVATPFVLVPARRLDAAEPGLSTSAT